MDVIENVDGMDVIENVDGMEVIENVDGLDVIEKVDGVGVLDEFSPSPSPLSSPSPPSSHSSISASLPPLPTPSSTSTSLESQSTVQSEQPSDDVLNASLYQNAKISLVNRPSRNNVVHFKAQLNRCSLSRSTPAYILPYSQA